MQQNELAAVLAQIQQNSMRIHRHGMRQPEVDKVRQQEAELVAHNKNLQAQLSNLQVSVQGLTSHIQQLEVQQRAMWGRLNRAWVDTTSTGTKPQPSNKAVVHTVVVVEPPPPTAQPYICPRCSKRQTLNEKIRQRCSARVKALSYIEQNHRQEHLDPIQTLLLS